MSEPFPITETQIAVADHRLALQWLGRPTADETVLVFLHEGLGCIALWRDFPARLCRRLGLPGLVYSRAGYGDSSPADSPRQPTFMHVEARQVLPALLDACGVRRAVLIGHSDGGSIALIAAAAPEPRLAGAIVMAPHLFVEPITLASIQALRERLAGADLLRQMQRYHRDAARTCGDWSTSGSIPRFATGASTRTWLAFAIPLLALQGLQDEYGTLAQLERLAQLAPHARWQALEACGHSPFLDQPERVMAACERFIEDLPR